VAYEFDVEERIREVKREAKAIADFFDATHRKEARISAESSIVGTIARRFRSFAQFDEEQKALRASRWLHNRNWLLNNTRGIRSLLRGTETVMKAFLSTMARLIGFVARPLHWIWDVIRSIVALLIWLPLAYLELLVDSIVAFAISLVAWPVVFGFIYDALRLAPQIGGDTLWSCMTFSFSTFFTLAPLDATTESTGIQLLLSPGCSSTLWSIEIIVGLVHLGVFISHLYSQLSRR
jgi:hypothetical protein